MNLLQVHNYYRERGGEDVVVEEEYNLLRQIHNVCRYQVDNSSELVSFRNRFRLLFNTHYSRSSARRINNIIRANGIDLMHVHNFFPLLSPSIFEAARKAGIPSVLTLHNYRLIHPNGLLFHKGVIDRRSVEGSAWSCVPDGVYRNSILQTAVVAHMIEYHRKQQTWDRVPTLFIALTHFAKRLFVEGGLPEGRIVVKPNFMEDPFAAGSGNATGSDYFLYAGRISREKGIRKLINCWSEADIPADLRIIGEGPDESALKEASRENDRIQWLGWQAREEVLQQLSRARALIFPSLWYEGFPMILVEALAAGCPVIVSDIGSQAEIIEHDVTGLHFDLDDSRALAGAIRSLSENDDVQSQMAANARQTYLRLYTPERNLKLMSEVYWKARELEVRYQASAKFRS